jgi:2,4-dienoyl-CoA reductase-like NADH-dependent reductase (Old Yellow Enzyme family)
MLMSVLFSKFDMGRLELKNRVVMAPMLTNWASFKGEVTPFLIEHYQRRAKGGVGLIIVEAASISPEGIIGDRQLGIWDEKFVPGLRQLCDGVHAVGAKVAIQLSHGGAASIGWEWQRKPPVAPSAIPTMPGYPLAKKLLIDEIHGLVESFGLAAQRAKDSGFDAIELHGCHGFLINQFISSLRNIREDEYGGNIERRMRFPLEVVQKIRKVVGHDYPVIFRISAHEYTERGHTLEEGKVVSQILAEARVDAIHVSAGDVSTSHDWVVQPSSMPQGILVPLAEAIKRTVGVPIIAVGRIVDPWFAEKVVAEGKADLVALGRELMKHPDWCISAQNQL